MNKTLTVGVTLALLLGAVVSSACARSGGGGAGGAGGSHGGGGGNHSYRGDSDQAAQQAAEALVKKFEAAYNAGNAAELASLFVEGGTYLTPGGTVLSDRDAIEKALAGRMKAGWTEETVKMGEAHAAGDAVWSIGEYTIKGTGQNSGKQIGGHYAEVLTQDGHEWHIRMLIGNLTPSHDVTGMTGTAPPK